MQRTRGGQNGALRRLAGFTALRCGVAGFLGLRQLEPRFYYNSP
jgi:hypothetical protein